MIAHVALPVPIESLFSYRIPQRLEAQIRPLIRVRVPFRNRTLTGVILEVAEGSGETLKEIQEPIDFLPHLNERDLELCRWSARYYMTPLGLVLKCALPPSIDPDKHLVVESINPDAGVFDARPLRKAARMEGGQGLIDYFNSGSVVLRDVFTGEADGREREEDHRGIYRVHMSVGDFEFRKRKYIALIAEALEGGWNVLVLLPDHTTIGDYFYQAFSESFPGKVFWYVSSDRKAKRMEAYFRARSGRGCVIMGNKSCAFLPVSRMALVIIERPEDDEYRNEEAFKYSAVRVVMKRAEVEAIPVYLGTAAPSLDLMKAVEDGLVEMEEAEKQEGAEVSVMRINRPRHIGYAFPHELHDAIERGIQSGETVAIYVPRRDYASHLYCLDCQSAFTCPACSGGLSYLKADNLLVCSRCRLVFPYEERCRKCGSTLIQYLSIGAEYLEERARELFPGVPVLAVTGGTARRKEASIVQRLAALSGGIVIGTSILSRLAGFHPENLIVLGLEDLLRIAGYRAREKVFQIFHNLKDALRPDRILIQVRDDSDMTFLMDGPQFYAGDLSERKASDFPPYKRLFLIMIRHTPEDGLVRRVEERVRTSGLAGSMMGPLKEAGEGGWRILLKGETEEVGPLLCSLYGTRGVSIEPDPLNI